MVEKMYYIVQALAQPAQIQEDLYPYFVEVADELAIDWEEVTNDENFSKYIKH